MWWRRKKPGAIDFLLQVLLTTLVPIVLMMTSVQMVLSHYWLNYEYSRDSYPHDEYGFSDETRLRLSMRVLDFIKGREGVASLAQDVGNTKAGLTEPEIQHLEDVRNRVSTFRLIYQLVLIGIVFSGWMLFSKSETRVLLWEGLVGGGLITLSVTTMLVLSITIAWDMLFESFHAILFAPDTWQFAAESTLIRLYPTRFWVDTTSVLLLITAAFAITLSMWPMFRHRS